MKVEKFKLMFKNNNGIPLTDELVLWRKPLELWNLKTNVVLANFKSLDEALTYDLGGEKIKDLVERTENFYFKYDGGRGADSGAMGGGFNHASGGGSGFDKSRFNAEFNALNHGDNSYENTLKHFVSKYANEDHEFGVAVDELGYVHSHIEGGKSSVAISGKNGQTILHNHPSGGNFSDSDLLSVSMGNEKGIVAVGKNGNYSFSKNSNFKANEFAKAVKSAKWPTKYDYDKGADWWLKKNAKKYGYTYSYKKA